MNPIMDYAMAYMLFTVSTILWVMLVYTVWDFFREIKKGHTHSE